jgi:hypothetical protein
MFVFLARTLIILGVQDRRGLTWPSRQRDPSRHVTDNQPVLVVDMPPRMCADQSGTCPHVVIQKDHGVIPGLFYSSLACRGRTGILLKRDMDSRLPLSPFTEKLIRAIVATVDDKYDLSGARIF